MAGFSARLQVVPFPYGGRKPRTAGSQVPNGKIWIRRATPNFNAWITTDGFRIRFSTFQLAEDVRSKGLATGACSELGPQHFGQARFYDYNVGTRKKRVEKLRFIHSNPVRRGVECRTSGAGAASARTPSAKRDWCIFAVNGVLPGPHLYRCRRDARSLDSAGFPLRSNPASLGMTSCLAFVCEQARDDSRGVRARLRGR